MNGESWNIDTDELKEKQELKLHFVFCAASKVDSLF